MDYRRYSIDYDENYELRNKKRSQSLLLTQKEKSMVNIDTNKAHRNFYELYDQQQNNIKPHSLISRSSCGNVSQRIKIQTQCRFSKILD